MTIILNGQPRTIGDSVTVAALLKELRLDTAACAVEINKTLVPKSRHTDRPLAEGDAVEIVTLVGGG